MRKYALLLKNIGVTSSYVCYYCNLVDIASSLLPNATDSTNRLKDKPDALQKKGQQVKSDMESLRKKINICRDMVNR